MKYVILSTDSTKEYYDLAPLVCYGWKKLGFTPVVHIVGDIPYEIVKLLLEIDPETKIVGISSVEGIKDSTVAQVSRLFQFCYFDDDDILLTSDIDMIVAKDFFSEHIGGKWVCFGQDLTGHDFPICYQLATAKLWKEVMGSQMEFPDRAKSEDWNLYWESDQKLLTERAKQYGFEKIKFVNRGNDNIKLKGLPKGRWDRWGWVVPDEIYDVHTKRNDPDAQLEVFKKLWPNDDDTWLRKFLNMTITDEPKKTFKAEVFSDEFGFLNDISNWNNHRCLLLLALQLTEGWVIEFGSGDSSTGYLRNYCNETKRGFLSYDNNLEWAKKCSSFHVTDWNDKSLYQECGVAFIDHAPGEHRWEAISNFKEKADIIVIHDSEPAATGYMLDKIWHLFKYRINVKTDGAWASAVSNKIDFKDYDGLELGGYKLSI